MMAKVKKQISNRNPKEIVKIPILVTISLCSAVLKSLFQTHSLCSLHPDYIQKIVNATL